MERIVGDLGHLRCKGGELKKKARDYIASRLLQIVLKLEHSGIGHLRLSWDSLFLREDGSFFLGNFGNGAPFDEVLSPLRGTLSPNAEPHTIYLSEKNKIVVPEAKGNMWSLGVLLYQLYTGNEHPYGKMEGSDWMQGEASLSEYLLRANIRSQVLIPQLEASKVPKRWAQLIVRLLV
ncbi:LOW QUALITY PROTEIN: uncharacterized protein EMH_0085030 [Eimeria mitis]|uniref:Protein kinase domain-containing protein n=1 Tax=Eimeria mitis TaxID=44415 RepID=U6KI15_9EIME|nr:LOW QUALITY PROTEIN: uncharacterized protein EMH_0085030 [Eimeria mitis]CDJ36426.1 hypothetical protein EMH_0085030 [Eimeria mitis]